MELLELLRRMQATILVLEQQVAERDQRIESLSFENDFLKNKDGDASDPDVPNT